jgi:hypothetical protein
MLLTHLVAACLATTLAGCTSPVQDQGWVPLPEGSGFTAKTPAGWSAESGTDGHVMIHSADRSSFVLLEPFKTSPGLNAAKQITPLCEGRPEVFPRVKSTYQKQISQTPDQSIAKLEFGSGMRANVLCSEWGGVGMLYVIAAPASTFEAQRPTLVGILDTFRYGTPPSDSGGGPGDGLTYTSWSDPNENAFTVAVPEGWNVSGGLTRATPFDLRTEVAAISPDGLISAKYGDAKMLPFIPIAGAYRMGGIREGMISSNHGYFMFLNWETGAQFSKGYLNLVLKKNYPDLHLTGSKDRPDIQQFVESFFAKSPIKFTISSGETDFTYTQNGRPMNGAIVCTNFFMAPGTMGQGWKAVPAVCTAPPEQMKTALSVLAHLSLPKYNPEWIAQANQKAAQFTDYVQQDAANTRDLHNQMYQNFSNQIAENGRAMDNLLTGSTDVRDSSGAAFHVASGHNYYYLGMAGNVVGSNSATPPDVGFKALTQF